MQSTATFKYIRMTPKKLRLVADMVRGQSVEKALDIMKFEKKAGSEHVSKIIQSAIANATQKGGVRVDRLFVKKICVDKGPILKRWMPRARGGASGLQKKMSHLTVVLDEQV